MQRSTQICIYFPLMFPRRQNTINRWPLRAEGKALAALLQVQLIPDFPWNLLFCHKPVSVLQYIHILWLYLKWHFNWQNLFYFKDIFGLIPFLRITDELKIDILVWNQIFTGGNNIELLQSSLFYKEIDHNSPLYYT